MPVWLSQPAQSSGDLPAFSTPVHGCKWQQLYQVMEKGQTPKWVVTFALISISLSQSQSCNI